MEKHYRFLPLLFFSVLISTFLVAGGCGKGYPGRERLHPVSITVTDNGTPFANATVVLLRDNGETTINAGGITDAHGVAKIQTDARWDGAPTGKYKVMLNKDVFVQGDLSEEEVQKLGFDEREAYNKKLHDKRMSIPLPVPAILRGMESPLTIEVTSSGDNTASFDIGKY